MAFFGVAAFLARFSFSNSIPSFPDPAHGRSLSNFISFSSLPSSTFQTCESHACNLIEHVLGSPCLPSWIFRRLLKQPSELFKLPRLISLVTGEATHVRPAQFVVGIDDDCEGPDDLGNVTEGRAPTGRPRREHDEENRSVYREWCEVCVAARGNGAPHHFRQKKSQVDQARRGPECSQTSTS